MSTPNTDRARRAGRPPLTDAVALLGAARELGFEGLTVGAITREVGVKYSTFYRHYPTLAALITVLVDAVLDDVAWPPVEQPWRQHLTELAEGLARLVADNPGLTVAFASLTTVPARLERAQSDAASVLIDAGATPADAALGVRAVLREVLRVATSLDDTERAAELAAAVRLIIAGISARSALG